MTQRAGIQIIWLAPVAWATSSSFPGSFPTPPPRKEPENVDGGWAYLCRGRQWRAPHGKEKRLLLLKLVQNWRNLNLYCINRFEGPRFNTWKWTKLRLICHSVNGHWKSNKQRRGKCTVLLFFDLVNESPFLFMVAPVHEFTNELTTKTMVRVCSWSNSISICEHVFSLPFDIVPVHKNV